MLLLPPRSSTRFLFACHVSFLPRDCYSVCARSFCETKQVTRATTNQGSARNGLDVQLLNCCYISLEFMRMAIRMSLALLLVVMSRHGNYCEHRTMNSRERLSRQIFEQQNAHGPSLERGTK